MTDGNDKAFPGEWQKNSLTKREYFAAMAMQGILANTFKLGQMGDNMTAINPEKISQQALLFTEALIKELNKKQ